MAPTMSTLPSSHFPTALRDPSFPSTTRCRLKTTKLKHKQLHVLSLRLSFNQSPTGCSQRLEQRNSVVRCISRAVRWAFFCLAIGFPPVFALPASAAVSLEYSEYTRSLSEEVSSLMKVMEEVKNGNGEMLGVESGLRAVKAKKEGLRRELVDELRRNEKKMNAERERLEKQAEDFEDGMSCLKEEEEEDEYEKIRNRIGKIEEEISRKKSEVSVRVHELCSVERECEEVVKKFRHDMRQKKSSRTTGFVPKLSRADIDKEMESAQRRYLKEMLLPPALEGKWIVNGCRQAHAELCDSNLHCCSQCRVPTSTVEMDQDHLLYQLHLLVKKITDWFIF